MNLFRILISTLLLLANGSLLAQNLDSTQWYSSADRASSATYMSAFEREVIKEVNLARTDPPRYARLYLEPILNDFKGNVNTKTNVATQEGTSAVREAIRAMKKTAALGNVEPSKELYATADYHTSRQSKTKEVGHTSPNGKTFADRMRGLKFPASSECISYGEETARGVVLSLLIDDGVADRGHRKNILDPRFNLVGVAAGGHKVYDHMATLDLALKRK